MILNSRLELDMHGFLESRMGCDTYSFRQQAGFDGAPRLPADFSDFSTYSRLL